MAFLPHILDAGAAGRQRHLGALRDLAARLRERPFGFLWAQGGAQPGLERNFEVGGCARAAASGGPCPAAPTLAGHDDDDAAMWCLWCCSCVLVQGL